MAIVAHVVEKTVDPGDQVINGICFVVIAIDNAVDTTDALVRARAATVINAALGTTLPSTYFDTNRLASVYDAAGDISVVNGRNVHRAIA